MTPHPITHIASATIPATTIASATRAPIRSSLNFIRFSVSRQQGRIKSLFVGNKDGAEPSIGRSSDAGATPAASTEASVHQGPTKSQGLHTLRNKSTARAGETGSAIWTLGMGVSVGANQDRRRLDGRSCARHDTAVTGSNCNCEQRQRSRRSAPRGVAEAGKPAPGNRKTGTNTISFSAASLSAADQGRPADMHALAAGRPAITSEHIRGQ